MRAWTAILVCACGAVDAPPEPPAEVAPAAPAPVLSIAEPSGSPIREVTLGERHGCVLLEGGALRCWGSHDGLTRETFTVANLDLPEVAEVDAGGWFTCARLADGQVRCWGMLPGIRGTSPQPIAVEEPAEEIACGMSHACARGRSGRVWCWGSNGGGALAQDEHREFDRPVAVPGIADATRIAAGHTHSCALRANGAVVCWGDASDGPIGPRVGIAGVTELATDAIDLAAGGFHTCVRRSDRSARCWGSFELRPERFVAVEHRDVASFALARDHVCALGTDGTVSCWGDNEHGQLGDGTRERRDAPVRARIEGARSIAASSGTTCALGASGLACWGNASEGRMPASVSMRARPEPVPGVEGASAIASVSRVTCALAGGRVTCWGSGIDGTHGPERVEGIEGASALAVGATHACAIVSGEVRCWGHNDSGQLGAGDVAEHRGVVSARVRDAVEVAIEGSGTCARTRDGDVSCWGGLVSPMFGERDDRSVRPVPTRIAGLRGVEQLDLGWQDACAVAGGRVLCWGRHRSHGRNCRAGPSDGLVCDDFVSLAPTAIEGVEAVVRVELELYGGWAHRADGRAYRLTLEPQREGEEEELGGFPRPYRQRVGARAELVERVSRTEGCWLEESRVRCAGALEVDGLAPARAVTSGNRHACALLEDGTVPCWGDNSDRQLGTQAPDPALPSPIAL